MIPLRYGPDIFNDVEVKKTNIMGITFDEIYRAYRLQRMDSTLITLWCISKYLDCIVEETKEEKALRMKRQQTQRQKEYEMIRKGIIPPDSIHLTANIMYRVVANIYVISFLREIIHPMGKFFDPESKLAMNHWALCEWTGSKRPYEPNLDPWENDDYEVLEKEHK
ncbi:hypothetical protein EJB05_54047, partial [Eragrostis curvula]